MVNKMVRFLRKKSEVKVQSDTNALLHTLAMETVKIINLKLFCYHTEIRKTMWIFDSNRKFNNIANKILKGFFFNCSYYLFFYLSDFHLHNSRFQIIVYLKKEIINFLHSFSIIIIFVFTFPFNFHSLCFFWQ